MAKVNNSENSLIYLIIKIFLIFCLLAVIIWQILLAMDYRRVIGRDNQRIVMINKVQDSLENYYQVNNYYPGTPYRDENNLLVYADWHYLIARPEMKNYYNFDEFKDPCQPQKAVGINGLVSCPSKDVTYQYVGIDCKVGCRGYKLTINLEQGGQKEFISKTILTESK